MQLSIAFTPALAHRIPTSTDGLTRASTQTLQHVLFPQQPSPSANTLTFTVTAITFTTTTDRSQHVVPQGTLAHHRHRDHTSTHHSPAGSRHGTSTWHPHSSGFRVGCSHEGQVSHHRNLIHRQRHCNHALPVEQQLVRGEHEPPCSTGECVTPMDAIQWPMLTSCVYHPPEQRNNQREHITFLRLWALVSLDSLDDRSVARVRRFVQDKCVWRVDQAHIEIIHLRVLTPSSLYSFLTSPPRRGSIPYTGSTPTGAST
jgi:hypothetical protein